MAFRLIDRGERPTGLVRGHDGRFRRYVAPTPEQTQQAIKARPAGTSAENAIREVDQVPNKLVDNREPMNAASPRLQQEGMRQNVYPAEEQEWSAVRNNDADRSPMRLK